MKPTTNNQKAFIAIPTIAVTTALMLVLPAIALADEPANPNCWGTVTSQRATTEGDIGQHASANEQGTEPREGLGNLADHPSELGTFLASVDELDATECP
jgi:hypothetical protein